MNKINYIILTLILCFSISFVVYPLKGFSYTETGYYEQPSGDYIVPDNANHIVELPPSGDETSDYQTEQYWGWFCNPTTESCSYKAKQSPGYGTQGLCEDNCIYCRYCRKWGYFFGANGCYGIKKCTNNIDECTTNGQCSGETTVTKYACSSTGCVQDNANGTYTTSNCDNKCLKRCVGISCQYNDNTSNSTCTYSSQCAGTKYTCSSTSGCVISAGGSYTTSNCGGKCVKRCVGTSCQYNDNTSNSTCANGSECDIEPPPPPPPTSPPPTCQIIEFSINGKTNVVQDPLIVWVKAPLTGYFSVNDTCKTCIVSSNDTWGYSPQTYEITTLDSDYTETFKINTSGIYAYTLTCEDAEGNEVQNTLSLQTVQALNLPWWREIIPNLGGFLRGL